MLCDLFTGLHNRRTITGFFPEISLWIEASQAPLSALSLHLGNSIIHHQDVLRLIRSAPVLEDVLLHNGIFPSDTIEAFDRNINPEILPALTHIGFCGSTIPHIETFNMVKSRIIPLPSGSARLSLIESLTLDDNEWIVDGIAIDKDEGLEAFRELSSIYPQLGF
ncbi:hypothetical protein M422DRAFT_48811 [Sphaerobolus stellatus SS14]|uniref:Uncharacterized protein n=1 Tax=Sphaerobolus stellatus (strain SS14) TaxID=990650 RepID=A0A0C9VHY3_SPHS4|nr:hypothetical protein M422DRAFT_48811 [Sphaerobolus stellatus SS14]